MPSDMPSDDSDIDSLFDSMFRPRGNGQVLDFPSPKKAQPRTAKPTPAPRRQTVARTKEVGAELAKAVAVEPPRWLPTPNVSVAQILDVSVDQYHSLELFSSSVAKTVIARSPAHAKAQIKKKPSKEMERGDVIHRLVLGKGKDFVVVHHDDWRTKAAQSQRDQAHADGLVPVLARHFEDYNLAAESIRVQLADRGYILDGESELAIGWTETTPHGPVACKAMLDHAWLERGVAVDLKITGDAEPHAVERTAENLGYAIQAAAYTRAIEALRPDLVGRVRFVFAFCEPEYPYAINTSRGDGAFAAIGAQRWERALNTWAECTANNRWPAYGDGLNVLSPPAWALRKEMEA